MNEHEGTREFGEYREYFPEHRDIHDSHEYILVRCNSASACCHETKTVSPLTRPGGEVIRLRPVMVRWWNGRAWIERHGFHHISCITRPCSAIVSHDLAEIDPVLCLDVRGYCSRRFHVQSFGHVFQVLIKLYDQNNLKHATADWESGGGDAHGRTLCNVVTLVCILLTLISSSC